MKYTVVTKTVSNDRANLVMGLNPNLVRSQEYQLGRVRNIVKFVKKEGKLFFQCPYTGEALFGNEYSLAEEQFRNA